MKNAVRPSILILAVGALAFSLGYVAFPHDESDHTGLYDYSDLSLDEGSPAAPLQVQWLDGTPLSSADLAGKVVIVDFWATWCGPCLTEIPRYNALHAEYKDRGVQMLGITLQSGSIEQVREWVSKPVRIGTQQFNLEYPVAMGNDDVEVAWGPIYGFPTTFLLDQNWKIRKKWIGAVPDKSDQLRVLIDQLLAEQKPAEASSP